MTDRTDERLTQLEIKQSYTEDLLDTLNDMVVKQQDQIDLLLRELVQLRRQASDDGMPRQRSLRDELPPHY
ncbi:MULTISPECIES: SlyX family protein [unclassified Hydrogenophaga]|jgi:SlyX protein|uniref:SlyX family protein n=1 Tax=unclassified Hydrogenophaga TaxID=2610897 RepID=UPI001F2B47A4|nr:MULTISPECIES: SlyX family protein [unclassified Hydrogenophaga]MBT9551539.1 SlyX family protein [Hydrogenophaga sp.]UJW79323.1 SlyX family protein [Hydrogenophaga sp. SL48]